MSGFRSQGPASCASAGAPRAPSAARVKRAFTVIPVIVDLRHQLLEQITNVIDPSMRPGTADIAWHERSSPASRPANDFVISCTPPCDYLPLSVYNGKTIRTGMIRMSQVVKLCSALVFALVTLASARADEFKLSNNQRIACSRGLAAGKLNTA